MFLVVQIAGQLPQFMNSWIWRVTSLALSLAGLLFCTSLVALIGVMLIRDGLKDWRKSRQSSDSILPSSKIIYSRPDVRTALLTPYGQSMKRKNGTATATKIIALTIAVGVGWCGGYYQRNQQLTSNLFTYSDVEVIRQLSPKSYMVHPARMGVSQWDFCTPISFKPGQAIIKIRFEQMSDCKNVDGPMAQVFINPSAGETLVSYANEIR